MNLFASQAMAFLDKIWQMPKAAVGPAFCSAMLLMMGFAEDDVVLEATRCMAWSFCDTKMMLSTCDICVIITCDIL